MITSHLSVFRGALQKKIMKARAIMAPLKTHQSFTSGCHPLERSLSASLCFALLTFLSHVAAKLHLHPTGRKAPEAWNHHLPEREKVSDITFAVVN
jgi:hypothetical protein